MINRDQPKTETIRILASESMSESGGGAYLEVIEDNHGARGSVVHREKQSVLPFCRIRRTVYQN